MAQKTDDAGDAVDVAAGAAGSTADVVDRVTGSAPPKAVAPTLFAMTWLKKIAERAEPVSNVLNGVKVGGQLADGDVRGATVTVAEETAETALTVIGTAAGGPIGGFAGYGVAQTAGQLAGQAYDNGASAATER